MCIWGGDSFKFNHDKACGHFAILGQQPREAESGESWEKSQVASQGDKVVWSPVHQEWGQTALLVIDRAPSWTAITDARANGDHPWDVVSYFRKQDYKAAVFLRDVLSDSDQAGL